MKKYEYALRYAMQMELDGHNFFKEKAETFENPTTKAAEKAEDENIKKLFEQLAKWEAGHEKIFKKEYDRRMEEYMNLPWGG